MTKPVTIPNTFATATTAIPLSQLDGDFTAVATAINDANTYSNYAADTGSANAYVVTFSGVSTSYSAGLRIQFKAGNANTGASTINVNAQGAKNITYQDASALASGAIAVNSIVDVMYDGTQFLLMNDPAGATGGDVTGPASATDNAVVRFDGTTGKLVQNSVVTIADSTGDVAGVGALTASGNLTLSGGTANGVLYLNGSKVATSGSAVTYNGTTFATSADASISGLTVGKGAGAVSTNTAVGASALQANTSGGSGTALGYQALYLNNTASNNTAVGYQALYANTTGANNTAVGYQALDSTTTGKNNTALGIYAGQSQTTATSNCFVGTAAGSATTGSFNTFIGSGEIGVSAGAGEFVTTGSKNTIIGRYSGNQGGLDIRTLSNYLVLSDGDGNPRIYHNGTTVVIPNLPTSSVGLPSGGLYVVAGVLMVA